MFSNSYPDVKLFLKTEDVRVRCLQPPAGGALVPVSHPSSGGVGRGSLIPVPRSSAAGGGRGVLVPRGENRQVAAMGNQGGTMVVPKGWY